MTITALVDSPARRLRSGKRRQMVRLTANAATASSARRSPLSVGWPNELETITAMPTMVTAMATATRRVIRSPRNSRADSAASSGDAATMATTLATRVWVIAVMKLIWLTAASTPTPARGSRCCLNDSATGRRSIHRPNVEYTNSAQHATQKATSTASASESRTHSESVDTDSIPTPASSHPRLRRSPEGSAVIGSR